MSNMRIIEIPASMRENAGRKNTVRKLRVAAYCRVSTEEEEQQGSFEIQKLYYTEKINSTPEWEVAGIYADDGISGVHTKKRDGFNQMIQDCKKRKIDLILTKSISRFARNTLDSIQYVRMLKQMGIAVVFEKENINTATMNSEMILTVLSAFAQAESESISQNVARGKRMGYKHGKFAFPYGRIIGYRKGADGKPEIIPEQAEVIRKTPGNSRNITLKITTRALSANRCSERCKPRSPAETVSRLPINASTAVAAITASTPCPNGWSAVTAAALTSG